MQTRPGYDVWGFEHTWKKGLFDCCDNKRICSSTVARFLQAFVLVSYF